MSAKRVKKKLKRIVYEPPSRAVIDAYAQQVCKRLAERDISYLTPEVTSGLTRFLQVAATIVAKQMNAESEAENESLANKNK